MSDQKIGGPSPFEPHHPTSKAASPSGAKFKQALSDHGFSTEQVGKIEQSFDLDKLAKAGKQMGPTISGWLQQHGFSPQQIKQFQASLESMITSAIQRESAHAKEASDKLKESETDEG